MPVASYLTAPQRQLPLTEVGVADQGVIPQPRAWSAEGDAGTPGAQQTGEQQQGDDDQHEVGSPGIDDHAVGTGMIAPPSDMPELTKPKTLPI